MDSSSGDSDAEYSTEFDIEENQFERLKERCIKDGLREGITTGQEFTLQTGFDTGYKQGFERAFPVARLRGVIWGILHFQDGPSKLEDMDQRIKSILSSVDELEKRVHEDCLTQTLIASPENTAEPLQYSKSCVTLARALEEECKLLLNDVGPSVNLLGDVFATFKL